ncbi:MAG TPA: Gfo/Idh/MocA family oxidoreductase [Bdellovibrionales bacterium]|nr:Gfo/Idh/MocA family oxidoreductase [Bdellovibrionales bacterium]
MIRIGVIGLGFGKAVHIPALRLDPRCEVVAISSRDFAKASAAAAALGVPRVYARWEELLADPGIDAVTIATPPAVQKLVLPEAIRAGKHVFCEKPMGLSAADAGRLAAQADEAGLANMIDYEFPELASFKEAKRRFGELGEPGLIVANWQVQASGYRENPPGWKVQPELGGGTLRYLACHCLYYYEWLMGPIASLQGAIEDDGALVTIRFAFASGASGILCVGGNRPGVNLHRVELYGSKGAWILENPTPDYMKGFTLRELGGGKIMTFEPNSPIDGRITATGGITKKFLDWIETGKRAQPSLADGARVEFLMEAIERAAGSGSVVNV